MKRLLSSVIVLLIATSVYAQSVGGGEYSVAPDLSSYITTNDAVWSAALTNGAVSAGDAWAGTKAGRIWTMTYPTNNTAFTNAAGYLDATAADLLYLSLSGLNSPTATINWGGQDVTNMGSLSLTNEITMVAGKQFNIGGTLDPNTYIVRSAGDSIAVVVGGNSWVFSDTEFGGSAVNAGKLQTASGPTIPQHTSAGDADTGFTIEGNSGVDGTIYVLNQGARTWQWEPDGTLNGLGNALTNASYITTTNVHLSGQATFPASPIAGDVAYHSVSNKHFGYNGSSWNALY